MMALAERRRVPHRFVPRFAWYVAGCAVALFACAIYSGALRNGFVYDDVPQVVKNPWIRHPRNLLHAFTMGSWAYEGTTSNYYRPLMHVLYTAAYAFFGLDPAGFHAVSVALHAAVSVLVFVASAVILDDGRTSAPARLTLAAAAGLLFAAHPIHTEAVSWIGGVPDLCAALFCLGSFCAYATAPRTRILSWRSLLSLALFLLAALSKEVALVFPAVIVAYDVAFQRDRMGLARHLGRYLGFLVVGIMYLTLRWNALGGLAPVHRHAELSGGALLLNAFPLFAEYLLKLALPIKLSVFHAFLPVASWWSAAALASLAVAALFAAAGIVLWKKHPGGAFVSGATMLAPLLPTLYIPALGENPFAERYLYLPSVGFVWLLVLAVRAARAFPGKNAGIAAAGAVLLAAYTTGVITRQPVWRSDLSLWEDAVAKSPSAPVAHYNLGAAFFAEGRIERAISEFEAAIHLQPSPVAWTALGVAYERLGVVDAAIRSYQAALSADPAAPAARHHLMMLLRDHDAVADHGAKRSER